MAATSVAAALIGFTGSRLGRGLAALAALAFTACSGDDGGDDAVEPGRRGIRFEVWRPGGQFLDVCASIDEEISPGGCECIVDLADDRYETPGEWIDGLSRLEGGTGDQRDTEYQQLAGTACFVAVFVPGFNR